MSTLINKSLHNNVFRDIRLVATDMDGTLTKKGKFTSELISNLETLAANKIDVLIVTGRSGGWVQGSANYLPIVGAIAENGGVYYDSKTIDRELLIPCDDISQHRQKLSRVFTVIKNKFPSLVESTDNYFRITDWTFDIGDLNIQELSAIENICHREGFGFTYSTVQCHIKPLQQNKADGLKQIIHKYFPQISLKNVVTVGDSPNDESLFNSQNFPLSVGVANISEYRDRLQHYPSYITSKPEVAGFSELVEIINKEL